METENDYGYYTITCDYMATGEGHHRMIMIAFCKSSEDAKKRFIDRFGEFYAPGIEINKKLEIPYGFSELLTDMAKRIIMQIKGNKEDAPPMFGYENFIYVNYS